MKSSCSYDHLSKDISNKANERGICTLVHTPNRSRNVIYVKIILGPIYKSMVSCCWMFKHLDVGRIFFEIKIQDFIIWNCL